MKVNKLGINRTIKIVAALWISEEHAEGHADDQLHNNVEQRQNTKNIFSQRTS